MKELLQDPYEIAKYIKESTKKTPVKAYVKGNLKNINIKDINIFSNDDFSILIGEYELINKIIKDNKIEEYYIENDRRNSAIPLLDLKNINARIEPGSFIRDHVTIEDQAVIMMGAVINIGAFIGERTMIDMNAVVGARAQIGKNCHIGAGAVVAGVLEPPSSTPVIIEDEVLVGANAVILEGVKISKNAVVAAGAVVTTDVPEGAVVAGAPAKIIKYKDEKTQSKTKILDDLRK